MSSTKSQTFEEAVAEFMARSREQIDKESEEHLPPWSPSPYKQSGPPYEYSQRFDARVLTAFSQSIGDSNPLFTDPEYGKQTKYGCQIAPGPILALVRYPSVHGAKRPGGYPLANYYSGAAWEFFDVVRVGSKFTSSKVTKEIFEKTGSRGQLVFMISENLYRDFHGDLIGKCYATQIMVPMKSMGSARAMSVERLGERMLYERKSHQYDKEQIEEVLSQMGRQERRGARPLHWEDVEVGEKVGPVVMVPWTLQDQISYHGLSWAAASTDGGGGDDLAFERAYDWVRYRPSYGSYTNPATNWPWTPNAEHEDALLAAYIGQPAPFDYGVQRTEMCQQLMSNWMGDDGFIRRMVVPLRKPVFYGDVGIYTGEVVKKFKEVQEGDSAAGAAPGKRQYHAVGIKFEGVNQLGEAQVVGTSTVYLPSKEDGPVQLPIPHPARPPYVPYETFYRDWY